MLSTFLTGRLVKVFFLCDLVPFECFMVIFSKFTPFKSVRDYLYCQFYSVTYLFCAHYADTETPHRISQRIVFTIWKYFTICLCLQNVDNSALTQLTLSLILGWLS
jgi:hypothetical protein